MNELVISPDLLRPDSMAIDPHHAEHCEVSRDAVTSMQKYAAMAAGVALLVLAVVFLGADTNKGADAAIKCVFACLGLFGYGFGAGHKYSVDLHQNGTIRSLMVTDEESLARLVARLGNACLEHPEQGRRYRVDLDAKTVTEETALA